MSWKRFMYEKKKQLSTAQKPVKAENSTYTRSYTHNPHLFGPFRDAQWMKKTKHMFCG